MKKILWLLNVLDVPQLHTFASSMLQLYGWANLALHHLHSLPCLSPAAGASQSLSTQSSSDL